MKVNEMEFVNANTSTIGVVPDLNYNFNKENIINASVEVKTSENILSLVICSKNSKIIELINKFIKRFIDIIVGCLGSIILIPLTLLVWTINKIYKEDNGPLFYVQERIGKNGEKFKMIKFRSMCIDADEKLEKFLNENPDVREEFRVYRKIKNDPRITKAGKFLRKTSLDEWPQFLSVLKGDMSLVRTTSIFRKRKRTNGQIL
jgi:undecaprenyl-phosphate galactose phosphotransferase